MLGTGKRQLESVQIRGERQMGKRVRKRLRWLGENCPPPSAQPSKSGKLPGPLTATKRFWNDHIFLFALAGRFGLSAYAWSTDFIDPVVATVFLETRTMWVILLRFWDNPGRKESNKRLRLGMRVFALLPFALVGLAFAEFSQQNEVDLSVFLTFGVILASLAGFLDGLNIERSLKFGEKIAKASNIEPDKTGLVKPRQLELKQQLAPSLLLVATTNVIVGLVSTALALTLHLENFTIFFTDASTYWAVLLIFVFSSLTIFFIRIGNLETTTLEANSIRYFGPVLTLALLFILPSFTNVETAVNIIRYDYFILGAVLVLTINVLINFAPESRREAGYTIFVLSLWIIGVFTVYRDNVLRSIMGEDWLWSGTTDYFALLALSSTLFVFIFSFRTSRIQSIIDAEEKIAFNLYWSIRANNRLGDKQDDILNCLIKVDKEEQIIEDNIESKFVKLMVDEDSIAEADKKQILSDFDYWLHSKTSRGKDMTEQIVLFTFAVMTVFLTLFTRPVFEYWNAFIYDVFSFLFSAAIIFMSIQLLDISRTRTVPLLEKSISDTTGKLDNQQNSYQNRLSQKILSTALAFTIGVIIVFLLLAKWVSAEEGWADWIGNWVLELRP